MHMRDANARQLRLNQIDLNVNAEMQLGKGILLEWLHIGFQHPLRVVEWLWLWPHFGDLQLINDVAAVSYVSLCRYSKCGTVSFPVQGPGGIHPIRANREACSYHPLVMLSRARRTTYNGFQSHSYICGKDWQQDQGLIRRPSHERQDIQSRTWSPQKQRTPIARRFDVPA